MTNNAYAKNNGDGLLCSILWCYHDNYFRYFMFGKYNGFVSKARVSACMYFLVYCDE